MTSTVDLSTAELAVTGPVLCAGDPGLETEVAPFTTTFAPEPAVVVGATMFVHRGFDPVRFLSTIEQERITQVFGLPMMYRAALEHPEFGAHDVSSLKRAVYAMAPMPEVRPPMIATANAFRPSAEPIVEPVSVSGATSTPAKAAVAEDSA